MAIVVQAKPSVSVPFSRLGTLQAAPGEPGPKPAARFVSRGRRRRPVARFSAMPVEQRASSAVRWLPERRPSRREGRSQDASCPGPSHVRGKRPTASESSHPGGPGSRSSRRRDRRGKTKDTLLIPRARSTRTTPRTTSRELFVGTFNCRAETLKPSGLDANPPPGMRPRSVLWDLRGFQCYAR